MLDISRDRVPTLTTLYNLVDLLASWKINQVQLYTEHTFAYRNHPEVWAEASPLTGEEILALDAYCGERFIELVPNQNSFGHMERWLKFPRYQDLGELTGSWVTPWGETQQGGFSLCPAIRPASSSCGASTTSSCRTSPAGCSISAPTRRSSWDRAAAPKHMRRWAEVVSISIFFSRFYREVQARGHTMQFWGDIITQHPELIGELPRNIIALEWGYEADHPFDAHCARFAAAGIPFYVCPGTGSWRTLAGRTDSIWAICATQPRAA